MRFAAGAAVLAIHAVSLGHGFVDFDDDTLFLNDPLLRRTDPGVLAEVFSPDRPTWRPLRDLSHWADFLLHGQDAFWAHLHNLVLLGAVLALGAVFFTRVGRGGVLGAVGLLLAFLHPVQVESIAWVSGRKELLAGVFFFATLLAFLGRRGALTVLFAALGVLSKGHLVVLPVVLGLVWLHERFREVAGGAQAPPLRWALGTAAVVAVVAAATVPFVASGTVVHHAVVEGVAQPEMLLADRLQLPLRYLGKVLWPTELNHIYLTGALGSAHTALAVASALVAAALLALAGWRTWRRDPRGPLLAVPMVLLLPYLHFKTGTVYMADRYLFLVLPFVASLLVFEAARLPVSRPLRIALPVALAALFAVRSLDEHAAWRHPVDLWARMTRVYPENDWGYERLGRALLRAGRTDDAARAWLVAAGLDPAETRHLNNAAVALLRLGEIEAARAALLEALRRNPDDLIARENLRSLPPPPSGTAPGSPPG